MGERGCGRLSEKLQIARMKSLLLDAYRTHLCVPMWHIAGIAISVETTLATLKSLQDKIASLQAKAEAIAAKQANGAIAKIHALMDEHGLTIADLGRSTQSGKGAAKTAKQSAIVNRDSNARYQDPKTGATWSGHGRAPGWIANAKNRDRFLIEDATAKVPAVAKKVAKPGNYVRGPQPALYRDPKTGAEWSGRGRAPAWLATAKNRSKFLIQTQGFVPREKKRVEKKALV
jgi:DNA-binding protein H-NS